MTEVLNHFRQLVKGKVTAKTATPEHIHNLMVTGEDGHGKQDGFSFRQEAAPSVANKSGQNALAAMVYFATQTDQLTPEKYREGLETSPNAADQEAAKTLTDRAVQTKIRQLSRASEELIERITQRTRPITPRELKDYMKKAGQIADQAWHSIKPTIEITDQPERYSVKWKGYYTSGRSVELSVGMKDQQLGDTSLDWQAGQREGEQLTQSSFLGKHLQEAFFALEEEQKKKTEGASASKVASNRGTSTEKGI